MALEIKEVGFDGLKPFIDFEWAVYQNDPLWVPHLKLDRKEFLDPKKNPFFEHSDTAFFLAFRDGKPVGRIAAVVNHNYNQFHEDRTGFFGLFDCLDDAEAAKALLDRAAGFLKTKGRASMCGPVNLSTNDEAGLLVEGHGVPPVIMMTYNPKYYEKLLESYGLKKAKDLLAYRIEVPTAPPERLRRGCELILKRGGFTIRTVRMKDFKNEVARIKTIYNSAWERNWGFVPMTDKEFDHLGAQMKMVLDPDFLFIAEKDGEPIGFSLTIPNLNEALIRLRNGRLLPFGLLKLLWHSRKGAIDSLRVITLGITKEHRNSGIDTVFYYKSFEAAIAKKYKWAEMSWILEDNVPMNRPLLNMGAQVYKRYRIYEKPL